MSDLYTMNNVINGLKTVIDQREARIEELEAEPIVIELGDGTTQVSDIVPADDGLSGVCFKFGAGKGVGIFDAADSGKPVASHADVIIQTYNPESLSVLIHALMRARAALQENE